MTPQEIKKIVENFLNNWSTEHQKIIEPWHQVVEDLVNSISMDYCIVKKSDIKRYYNVDKCTIRDHKKRCGDKAQTRAAARIRLCESLFGKQFFEK